MQHDSELGAAARADEQLRLLVHAPRCGAVHHPGQLAGQW
jgi:hypothetical protein